MAGSNISGVISHAVQKTVDDARKEVKARTYRAANELRNAELQVLRGSGGGRIYRIPNTGKYYTASAPGQPPAVRTGAFRASWATKVTIEGGSGGGFRAIAAIESAENVNGYILGDLLENGTGKMAARPYKDRIKQMALPQIIRIYSAPY